MRARACAEACSRCLVTENWSNRRSRTSERGMSMGVSPSGHDENIFASPHHVVFAQLELAVADAFAGLELVFVAMPRTDEMHLIAERLAVISAVGGDEIDHPVDEQSFAGRPARMQAVVAVGIECVVLEEHPDLVWPGGDDPAVAVRQLVGLGDKPFGHEFLPRAEAATLLKFRRTASALQCCEWRSHSGGLHRGMPRGPRRHSSEARARSTLPI